MGYTPVLGLSSIVMAEILFTTMGTWGDLFPFLGVGGELQRRGHHVRVGAPPVWRTEVESSGLDFVSLGNTSTFREYVDHPEVLAPIPWGLWKAMQWYMFDQVSGPGCHASSSHCLTRHCRKARRTSSCRHRVPDNDPERLYRPRREQGGTMERPLGPSREPGGLASG